MGEVECLSADEVATALRSLCDKNGVTSKPVSDGQTWDVVNRLGIQLNTIELASCSCWKRVFLCMYVRSF